VTTFRENGNAKSNVNRVIVCYIASGMPHKALVVALTLVPVLLLEEAELLVQAESVQLQVHAHPHEHIVPLVPSCPAPIVSSKLVTSIILSLLQKSLIILLYKKRFNYTTHQPMYRIRALDTIKRLVNVFGSSHGSIKR
jgi:hypothetical protein